jgi:hypothetical protein
MQLLVAYICAPILAIGSGTHIQNGLDDGVLLLYSAYGSDSFAVRCQLTEALSMCSVTRLDATHLISLAGMVRHTVAFA